MTFARRVLRPPSRPGYDVEGNRSSAARRPGGARRASACRCRTTATARRTSTSPRPRSAEVARRWQRSTPRAMTGTGTPRVGVHRARDHGLAHGGEPRSRGLRADRLQPDARARPRRGWPSTAARVADAPREVAECARRRDHDGRRRPAGRGGPARRGRRRRTAPPRALLFIDMSTIAPGDARAHRRALAERGTRSSTRRSPARRRRPTDGTLTIMGGGADEDIARARPLFEAMGEMIVHVGALGQGQAVKVISNAVSAVNCRDARPGAGASGSAAGVDVDALVEVMRDRLGRLGDARAQGQADARARLHAALQARAHAQGRAAVPRGGLRPARRSLPRRGAPAGSAHGRGGPAATRDDDFSSVLEVVGWPLWPRRKRCSQKRFRVFSGFRLDSVPNVPSRVAGEPEERERVHVNDSTLSTMPTPSRNGRSPSAPLPKVSNWSPCARVASVRPNVTSPSSTTGSSCTHVRSSAQRSGTRVPRAGAAQRPRGGRLARRGTSAPRADQDGGIAQPERVRHPRMGRGRGSLHHHGPTCDRRTVVRTTCGAPTTARSDFDGSAGTRCTCSCCAPTASRGR